MGEGSRQGKSDSSPAHSAQKWQKLQSEYVLGGGMTEDNR